MFILAAMHVMHVHPNCHAATHARTAGDVDRKIARGSSTWQFNLQVSTLIPRTLNKQHELHQVTGKKREKMHWYVHGGVCMYMHVLCACTCMCRVHVHACRMCMHVPCTCTCMCRVHVYLSAFVWCRFIAWCCGT